MVKSDENEIISEELENEEDSDEDIQDGFSKEDEEEVATSRLPKWAKILLMILPAALYVTIIVLVDHFVGFPEKLHANALIAITGVSLLGFVVIGDMLYRNVFIYRMLRRESKKSKIYKEILRDKKEAKAEKIRFDELDDEDEYSYEDDDEELIEEEEEQLESDEDYEEYEVEDEYEYDYEDEDDSKYYRTKSLAIRGGIFSILIVNAFILIGLAVILQIALYGGFVVSGNNENVV